MRDIKTEYFENVEELCEDVSCAFEHLDNEYPCVTVVAKHDEARKILSEFCILDYLPFSIELHNEEFEGYYDEYLISLTEDGIYCERAKLKDEYLNIDASYVYVLENCNSKILSKIESNHVCEVRFGVEDGEIDFDDFDDYNEDDYDDFDYGLECCDCCDDDMHGFTAHRNDENGYSSVSFYSTEKIDADEMRDIMRIFGL